jgi:crotonobetainyl-CoA:carnitine CoA-transferase CaiB-like acyl-CoA transferase
LEKTNAEWLSQFRGIVPSGPVNSIEQAFEDEQIEARGLMVDVDHPFYGTIKQITSPIVTEGSNQANSVGPALGQHTNEILIDLLSMNPANVQQLRDSGAVM